MARKGFVRAVLVLVSGTALAHGITIVTLPLLSRLYGPADFGLLAVFAGLIAMGGAAACLRFDVAVPLPQEEDAARTLLALALLSSMCLGGIGLLVCLLAPQQVAAWVGQPALSPYIALVPVGICLSGMYASLQAWQVRQRLFSRIARTRVAQSAGATATQLVLGLSGVQPLGLLLGPLLNAGVACLAFWRTAASALRQSSVKQLLLQARSYRHFPLYSTPEALANSASLQLSIIMIAAMATTSEAGHLMMAMYVMQAPMALIGNAINQVYLSRAPSEYRAGQLGSFTLQVIEGLMRTGVGPLLAVAVLAPFCFEGILGAGWGRAGWLLAWMTPWFICQFLAAPVSMALHIVGRQRSALLLQVFGLVLRTGAVALGAASQEISISAAFAISGFVFYLVYLVTTLHAASVGLMPLTQAMRRAMPVILLWVIGAVLSAWLIVRFGLAAV